MEQEGMLRGAVGGGATTDGIRPSRIPTISCSISSFILNSAIRSGEISKTGGEEKCIVESLSWISFRSSFSFTTGSEWKRVDLKYSSDGIIDRCSLRSRSCPLISFSLLLIRGRSDSSSRPLGGISLYSLPPTFPNLLAGCLLISQKCPLVSNWEKISTSSRNSKLNYY
ncbi:hypothetical protein PMAYCL1PPCAC_29060 [Pristionchus mayeri]|uniref:Uncharacterized protein n=1 Tax=Pristionchus mayeri TaxID=1317129 RepID=A0AAN5DA39_9BILA|nr:hypothetical protein PMAYCL1PPCAC_29060 [Pristionchus mayeri]